MFRCGRRSWNLPSRESLTAGVPYPVAVLQLGPGTSWPTRFDVVLQRDFLEVTARLTLCSSDAPVNSADERMETSVLTLGPWHLLLQLPVHVCSERCSIRAEIQTARLNAFSLCRRDNGGVRPIGAAISAAAGWSRCALPSPTFPGPHTAGQRCRPAWVSVPGTVHVESRDNVGFCLVSARLLCARYAGCAGADQYRHLMMRMALPTAAILLIEDAKCWGVGTAVDRVSVSDGRDCCRCPKLTRDAQSVSS